MNTVYTLQDFIKDITDVDEIVSYVTKAGRKVWKFGNKKYQPTQEQAYVKRIDSLQRLAKKEAAESLFGDAMAVVADDIKPILLDALNRIVEYKADHAEVFAMVVRDGTLKLSFEEMGVSCGGAFNNSGFQRFIKLNTLYTSRAKLVNILVHEFRHFLQHLNGYNLHTENNKTWAERAVEKDAEAYRAAVMGDDAAAYTIPTPIEHKLMF